MSREEQLSLSSCISQGIPLRLQERINVKDTEPLLPFSRLLKLENFFPRKNMKKMLIQ